MFPHRIRNVLGGLIAHGCDAQRRPHLLQLELLERRETPAVADLAVTKTDGLLQVAEGATATYSITVTNNGPEAVSNVTIADHFPIAGNWFASGLNGATVSQSVGSSDVLITANLPVGGVVSIGSNYFVPRRTGTLVNTVTATLAPGDTDPNPANNSATDVTLVGQSSIGDFGGNLYAVGSGPGAGHVNVYSNSTGQLLYSFFPYGAGYAGGVRVATGDVTGDGRDDIVVGTGPGNPPHVKAFDGTSRTEVASFYAFDPSFRGGVFVAAAELNPSPLGTFVPHPQREIVVGADAGADPHVVVFSVGYGAPFPNTPLQSFHAYDPSFRGGVRVAAADIDGVPGDEVITAPGPGAPPHVKAFAYSGAMVASFYAFDPRYAGGLFVAGGNVNGTGPAEIVVGADQGNSPHVKVFDGTGGTTLASFLAFGNGFVGGVRVGTADRDGDGRADIVTGAGAGAAPHVKTFASSSLALLDSYFAFDPAFPGGVFVG